MLQLMVIDDASCKRDFTAFVSKHKKAVTISTGTKTFVGELQKLIKGIKDYNGQNKRLAVSTTESLALLNVSEIVHCQSNRNYTYIYLTGERKLIASKTLMDFEEVLIKYGFLRIHKSHLINVNYMDKYMKSEGGYILMLDGSRLPVSVRKKEYLFRELDKL